MNYKNNTPFKLKGSPFKQDPNKNKLIGGAAGRNTDFTTQADGSTPTEYTNTRRNVYDGDNLVQSLGGGVKEENLGNGITAISSAPPVVETTSANGSVSLADGSISHTNKMTTTTSNSQQSAGDVLASDLPSYKQAWESNLEGIQGMYANREEYEKDMGKIEKGDARDVERENQRKKVKKASLLSGSGTGTTNTQTFSNTDPLETYQYGTKQGSYQSRQNIRNTKQSSNTTKNRTISNARLDWKGMSDNEKLLATGGKEDKDGNITGGSGKRGDYMKSKKIDAKKEKNNSILETSRSETKNSQRASDQNIADGGKVRGNKVKVTTANTQQEIQAAQDAKNQANNAIKKNSGLTPEEIAKIRNANSNKKTTPFKMHGYGSKTKNK